MQEYRWYHAIYMSFYSKKLYQDVAKNWGGKSFLYLLLLVALSWIIPTAIFQLGLNRWYQSDSDKIVYQVPEITLKDGVMSTPEKHPYIITAPDDVNKRLAVIDETGQYQTLDQAHTDLLITKTEVISRSKPNEIKINTIPNNLNLTVEPKVVNSYVKDYLYFAWIFFFPFVVLFSYLFRLCQSLLYSIIGVLFGYMSNADLGYGKIFLISLVSITPTIIVSTILSIFAITFRHEYLLFFVLAMIYLYFGIAANREIQNKEVKKV